MLVKSEIEDLKLFKVACENLDIKFDENQKTVHSRWAGETECVGVFSDNQGGEGGVKLKEGSDTNYEIVWDNYANSLVDVVGDDCSKLMRGYTTAVVKKRIEQVGMLTNEEIAEDNSIILTGVFV